MKSFITLIALFAATQSFAQSEPVLRDIPAPDQIASIIEFNGKPGVTATASLIKTEDENYGSLLITHQKAGDMNYYVGAMNAAEFTVNEMLPGYTTLEANKAGSLLIKSKTDTSRRELWNRTLTVAYRNNTYKIIGFTYSVIDTIDSKNNESCDYNLQTKRGTKNGRNVRIATGSIELNSFADDVKFYGCNGW